MPKVPPKEAAGSAGGENSRSQSRPGTAPPPPPGKPPSSNILEGELSGSTCNETKDPNTSVDVLLLIDTWRVCRSGRRCGAAKPGGVGSADQPAAGPD